MPIMCIGSVFAVPLLQPNEEGLPSTEESLILNDIEDALSDRLEADQDGLLTVVVTTSSMREFVFYTRKPGTIEAIVSDVQQGFPNHKIQFYVAVDKIGTVTRDSFNPLTVATK